MPNVSLPLPSAWNQYWITQEANQIQVRVPVKYGFSKFGEGGELNIAMKSSLWEKSEHGFPYIDFYYLVFLKMNIGL